MRPLQTRSVFHCGLSPLTLSHRGKHLPGWLGHFSVFPRMRLTLGAQPLSDGSESACLCIHEVWFCLKAEFPEQDNVMVPYGLCFMVSLRLSVPAQSCVKAVLEALKRYLSTVIDLSLGLKMRIRSAYPPAYSS